VEDEDMIIKRVDDFDSGNRKSGVLTNENSSQSASKKAPKANPYVKTVRVLQQVERVVALRKKKCVFIYAWNKLQKEVIDYWKDRTTKVPANKLQISEDQRLPLMAYAIIQS
jgi:hypothetical protein